MTNEATQAVVYFYTTRKQLQEYQRHGAIPVDPVCPMSINPEWEVSAQWMGHGADGRRRLLSKEETRLWGAGLVRISIAAEQAPTHYVPKIFWRMNSETREIYKETTSAGAKQVEWRWGTSPIPVAAWLAVEIEQDGQWVPLAGGEAKG